MNVLYFSNLKFTNVLVLINICLLMEPQCYDIITEYLMDVCFCCFFTFLEQADECDIEGNPHCNDSSRTCTYIEASQTSKCLCNPWGMNPKTKQCFSKYAF